MTFKCLGAQVRLHPLFALLSAVYLLSGRFVSLLSSLTALALHECGHLIALRAFKTRVTGIELTPFGGMIEAEDDALTGGKACLVASAGLLVNAILSVFSVRAYALSLLPFHVSQAFLRANLALLFINLLPVLPLDGGRLLQILLRRFFDENAVARWLTAFSTLCGLALIAVSVCFALSGELLFSPAFSGLYLLYMASAARRGATGRYVSALIARRHRLSEGGVMDIQWLAAGEHTPARALLGKLSLGKYHMVSVLREDGRRSLGTLNEDRLCESLLSDPNAPLRQCLSRQKGQS